MPVYNDWEAAVLVCRSLDAACRRLTGVRVTLYLVDDWSSQPFDETAMSGAWDALASIRMIRLRRNVGNQRAIAIGLSYLYEHTDAAAVVVMDSDGEDKPEDVPVLIEQYLADPARAIFAERRRRFQGRVFALGYHLYRLVHWVLTGISVRIGNFSIVPRAGVGAIILTSESWSHYAAGAVKARIPIVRIPIDRGRRLAGESKMNVVGLVTHGLSAVSVFRELVGTRLLLASVLSSIVGCAFLALLAFLALTHRIALDRLTATLFMLTLLTAVQGVVATFTISFSVLSGSDRAPMLPGRDYQPFIASVTTLHGS
jgi:hypothetical protein